MGRSCVSFVELVSGLQEFLTENLGIISCTTCRLNSWSCTGHAGHIELPVPVYNVTFFDHIYRLLRAQCVYCHRLQMPRSQVNLYTCKLRLLQYGLIDEVAEVTSISSMKGSKSRGKNKGDDSGDDEEDDDETVMEKRTAYVNRRIKEAKKDGRLDGLMAGAKNPIAAEQRRETIKEFLKDINKTRKCANCSGYAP